ncbi:MAG: hypothetical protein PHW35_09235 [Lentimicrobiaceae bacterium]|nr:hypothetical protein [Lentimicrobiaceae bacterium]
MNNIFIAVRHLMIQLMLLFVFSGLAMAQQGESKSRSLTPEEKASFEKQATQLVGFMEYAFNTLGNSKSDYRDKDIIINQSYLKFFKNAEVQIEDDLLEKRDVVTNKNVQAYLKDIDFFYKEVTFKYNIEEITSEVNEMGEIYFQVKASRNLKGTNIEGKEVNNNQVRYIELNLDDATRDLKIVSIYTTKSSEEQELMAWWNALNNNWRTFFAKETEAAPDLKLKDIIKIGKDFVLVKREVYNDSIAHDSIAMSASRILGDVRKIWRTESISLADNPHIATLDPLSALTALKYLDISATAITDLQPIRNLTRLEHLDISKTRISSIEPLQYCISIQNLNLSNTPVNSLNTLENFVKLAYLDISSVYIYDISPLAKLNALKELRAVHVPVGSFEPLSGLTSLELLDLSGSGIMDMEAFRTLVALKRISLERTSVSNIDAMSAMKALQFVYLDSTLVADLDPLSGLPELRTIYCDHTLVGSAEAQEFMQANPDVKVIYESVELEEWWKLLSPEWKAVFSKEVIISNPPEREQLHEITYLKKLNVSNERSLRSVEPLRKLVTLEQLDVSGTGITDVSALADLINLRQLDLGSTIIANITPIITLTSLTELDISFTGVADLEPITALQNLRILKMDSIPAINPEVLALNQRLQKIYADGVRKMPESIDVLWDQIPEALIIYRTPELQTWWQQLNNTWRDVFDKLEPGTGTPDRERLHRIASIRSLDLSQNRDIINLYPLRMLQQLEVLNISGLPVNDISPLMAIHRLVEFNCSNTPVTDLSGISGQQRLKVINCSNTPLNNIDPLGLLPIVEDINISGTDVSKLNALGDSYSLVTLSCFNTRINNLKPLEDLDKLKVLRIYNTRVSSRRVDKFKELRPDVEVIYY